MRPSCTRARHAGDQYLVAKAKAQPPASGRAVVLRPRAPESASAVAEDAHLRGDIAVVGPVFQSSGPVLEQLTWSSLLAVVTVGPPRWLEATDERSAFHWARSEVDAKVQLAFAARISFAGRMNILGEGVDRANAVQWAVGRFDLATPTAGLSSLAVGAVLVGPSASSAVGGPRHLWQAVAADMILHGARIVMLISCPSHPLIEHARRLHVVLKAELHASTAVECKEVRHVAMAFGSSVQILALGRVAGFDGALATTSAVAETRVKHSRWRRLARQCLERHQGTLDMILPLASSKYVCADDEFLPSGEGELACVWLKGDSRRSAESVVRRNRRTLARWELVRFRWAGRTRSHRQVDPEDL